LTAAFIYNPVAGTLRRHPQRVPNAIAALRAHGYDVRQMPTTGPQVAGEFASRAVSEGVDLVVGCGGDGTLNETAAGLIGTRTPFLPLPGGTANVLCMETGLGRDLVKAAARVPELVPRRIAVGRYQERCFLLMAGIGLDAHIVEHLDPSTKKRLGKLAYWLAGFQAILRWLPEFDVIANGETHRVSMALVTRVRNYGGDLEIARRVRLSDDDFDLVLLKGRAALRYGLYFAGILTNTLGLMPGARVVRARDVQVGAPLHAPIFGQLDGESVGPVPARITIVPDALTILLPKEYGGPWKT
jgi:diacylglycerol kinase (ATP)